MFTLSAAHITNSNLIIYICQNIVYIQMSLTTTRNGLNIFNV